MIRPILRVIGALLAALVIGAATVSLVTASPSDLDIARATSARFHSVEQATAMGYGLLPEGAPLHECIASFDGTGAMGLHYINGNLLDGVLDPAEPEALVYAPDGHGNLKLAALEYVIFDGAWTGSGAPTLFGQSFMHTGSPNRYEIPAFWALHVWLWDTNPSGLFMPFNPDVSCP